MNIKPNAPQPAANGLSTALTTLCLVFTAAICARAADHPAINDPDRFAWELFVQINQPDGANPHVTWETWALARDVFANPDAAPNWIGSPGKRLTTDSEPLLQQLARKAALAGSTGGSPHADKFDPGNPTRNETRMNRAAFDFVVDNELYNIEGQELFHEEGRTIDFPIEAMEIKARWEPIDLADREKFHTASIQDEAGNLQVWGLKALHITTKDLPNWFWATWEHTSNPGQNDVIRSIDRFRFANDGSETPSFSNLISKLDSPKWSNYVLRGTQVDFTDATGRPTRLANSIIEKGFQSTSSCITCHARSSIGARTGDRANRIPIFELSPVFRGSIGTPDHKLFWDSLTGEKKYTQTDFVWSLFRAQRKTEKSPDSEGTSTVQPKLWSPSNKVGNAGKNHLKSERLKPAGPQSKTTRNVKRETPRLEIFGADTIAERSLFLEHKSKTGAKLDSDALAANALQFLAKRADVYKLPADVSNLKLVSQRKSPLGTHYQFSQILGGQEVLDAGICVTVDPTGKVTKVYNNTYPVSAQKVARASVPELSAVEKKDREQEMIEIAWKRLGGQELFGDPLVSLVYLPEDNSFRPAYSVRLHLRRDTFEGEENHAVGEWRVLIDALTQEVIGQPEQLSSGKGSDLAERAYTGFASDFAIAAQHFHTQKKQSATKQMAEKQPVDGDALVFDPDPRSYLQSTTLIDASPASAFESAYLNKPLLQITQSSGIHHLDGPWIMLIDFEPPFGAPSTSPTGTWTAKRGNKAFNDVMTYFHIDQSQRYIQSLGFAGSTAIQGAPIEVDADGVSGADNSHFIPSSNRLAFGHGCVDDNEDADVILHEYGHAITHSINSSWHGGDTGAMGEGFGDYWAETYSRATLTSTFGASYNFGTQRVFDWDSSSSCWPGRKLDVNSVEYEPTRTYGAHQPIGSGVQSDELWSTPLYQAHLELRASGIPREEIDTIVLSSMFGLGANLTMRDLATNIVSTARALFPAAGDPHAEVFERHFKSLKILP